MPDLASLFLLEGDPEDHLWELYHANSKLTRFALPPARLEEDPVAALNQEVRKTKIAEIETAVGTGGKRYSTAEGIELPSGFPPALSMPFREVLEKRASLRDFGGATISLENLSALVSSANGTNRVRSSSERLDVPTRFIPSAGALYPLELYLLAPQPLAGPEESAAEGVWHYEPNEHRLERILRCPPERIRTCFQSWPENPPSLVAVFTGVPKRQTWKYGNRAYRYTLMEAGHAAQNLILCAAALNLRACPVVGYYDDAVHDLLDIDGLNEIALYCVFLGTEWL